MSSPLFLSLIKSCELIGLLVFFVVVVSVIVVVVNGDANVDVDDADD